MPLFRFEIYYFLLLFFSHRSVSVLLGRRSFFPLHAAAAAVDAVSANGDDSYNEFVM